VRPQPPHAHTPCSRAMKPKARLWISSIPALLLAGSSVSARQQALFRITVVDVGTGRGVPLIELTTTGNVTYVTDSAGVIAFDEPGLFDQDVFFYVKGHGYAYPKDGFGFTGVRLRPTAGGAAVVKVERDNIAERLYRITGGGIYRDSVLLGDTPPLREPLLNGQVLGQDSVQNAVYRGKLYWFWGDTNRPSYPLGQFSMSGAVSDLPGQGGLDSAVGVDLTYFVDAQGFSRPMLPIPDMPGAVWADGFTTAADPVTQEERILCHWIRVKDLGTQYEQGLARYDDAKALFEPVQRFPLDAPLYMRGHPLKARETAGDAGAVDWAYFPVPYPFTRVRADYRSLLDLTAYEAYTCLREGARYDKEHPALERDAEGRLVFGWKRDTAPLGPAEEAELMRAGLIKPEEALIQTRDLLTGKRVQVHSGSVFWNDYRGRWVMLGVEIWGSSPLGEVWFSEADTPTGPWVYARKIVTHDNYSFYNVKQHPYFDQDDGRIIYFEGTYTTFMTDAKPTPRYDYNQIMYRLDLADPRLALPVPVYRTEGSAGRTGPEAWQCGEAYLTARGLRRTSAWARVKDSPFELLPWRGDARPPGPGLGRLSVAYEPPHPGVGKLAWPTLAVTAAESIAARDQAQSRRIGAEESLADGCLTDEVILGWVLLAPPESAPGAKARPDLLPLYEYRGVEVARRVYSTEAALPGLARSTCPLCYVWRTPYQALHLDWTVGPAR